MTSQVQDTESDRPGNREERSDRANTGIFNDRVERAAVGVFGGAILLDGLRRRSLRGAATALVGGLLLYGSLGGDSRIEQALESRIARKNREVEQTETPTETSVSRSITVGESPEELYEAWRDPETFSRIMSHVAEVTPRDEERHHWTVNAPRGRKISWETHIVEEGPGEHLRWESPPDAMLPNEGSVRFRPASGDRGTVVTLSITLDPPGGTLGSAVLKRLGIVPETLAGEALRRFKSLVETGEIQTLSENPSGRGKGDLV